MLIALSTRSFACSSDETHGMRVAVAFVPAAHTSPLTFQYIARSTTIG
jgi:hypothetical protein